MGEVNNSEFVKEVIAWATAPSGSPLRLLIMNLRPKGVTPEGPGPSYISTNHSLLPLISPYLLPPNCWRKRPQQFQPPLPHSLMNTRKRKITTNWETTGKCRPDFGQLEPQSLEVSVSVLTPVSVPSFLITNEK